tara:strand:+ start:76 stop:501 length:426 start_codon:yes stop_codon:yes gene_type:complete
MNDFDHTFDDNIVKYEEHEASSESSFKKFPAVKLFDVFGICLHKFEITDPKNKGKYLVFIKICEFTKENVDIIIKTIQNLDKKEFIESLEQYISKDINDNPIMHLKWSINKWKLAKFEGKKVFKWKTYEEITIKRSLEYRN